MIASKNKKNPCLCLKFFPSLIVICAVVLFFLGNFILALDEKEKNHQKIDREKNIKKEVVEKVVDGDTFILNNGEVVRFIGVDTPELNHPEKPEMYYAKEAKEYTERMCTGKIVTLEIGEPSKDQFSRTLAYVYLPQGEFLNLELVKNGYGYAMTRYPHPKMEEFVKAEQEAREDNRGLWYGLLYDMRVQSLIQKFESLNEDDKKSLEEFVNFLNKKKKGEN